MVEHQTFNLLVIGSSPIAVRDHDLYKNGDTSLKKKLLFIVIPKKRLLDIYSGHSEIKRLINNIFCTYNVCGDYRYF